MDLDLELAAVERDTIRARAEDALRDAIVEGRLAPGERLVERRLCEALQVSRSSLREALRSLAAEGLVEVVAHRGPVVCVLSPGQARELYAMRAVLEGLAAGALAARHDAPAIARMAGALHAMREVQRGARDRATLAAADDAFRRALLDGAGNRTLGRSVDNLLARTAVLRRASLARAARLAPAIEELARVVAAIRAGDVQAAERAAREHVERACEAELPLLDDAARSPRRNAA